MLPCPQEWCPNRVTAVGGRGYDLRVKYCTGCGQPRIEGSVFCTNCGQRTAADTAQTTATASGIAPTQLPPASHAAATRTSSTPRLRRRTLAISAVVAVAAGSLSAVALIAVRNGGSTSTPTSTAAQGDNSLEPAPAGAQPVETNPQLLACNPTPPGGRPVDAASPSASIAALQWGLANLGYGVTSEPGATPLPVTGTFDEVTRSAVGRFQVQGRALPQTRIGDAATWSAMSQSLRTFAGANRC